MEEKRKHQRQIQDQRAMCLALDGFNKQKIAQKQKDMQDALAYDLKVLAELAQQELQDKQARSRRRKELHAEMNRYREHLKKQLEIEAERDREINRHYAVEQEKVLLLDTRHGE
jgi:hypothetical protein